MNRWLDLMSSVLNYLKLAVLCVAIGGGCSREDPSGNNVPTEAELKVLLKDLLIFDRAEVAYRTNRAAAAYHLLLNFKTNMADMEAAGRHYLDYVYCRAVVNGQLFVLAEHLGDTNAAEGFFKESAYYWEQHRKEGRLPAEELSRARVGDLILKYDQHSDAKLGPVLWRQESAATTPQ